MEIFFVIDLFRAISRLIVHVFILPFIFSNSQNPPQSEEEGERLDPHSTQRQPPVRLLSNITAPSATGASRLAAFTEALTYCQRIPASGFKTRGHLLHPPRTDDRYREEARPFIHHPRRPHACGVYRLSLSESIFVIMVPAVQDFSV